VIITRAHAAVDTMIAIGVPFASIEDYINALPLASEHQSALWLLAWAEATDPETRRTIVAQTLASAEAAS
jgi:hypothetical protein